MQRIAILGAGVMGSAMAFPATAAGRDVTLVGTHLDAAIVDSVAGNGHHPRLNLAMPAGVEALHHDAFGRRMAEPCDLVILGVSSAGVDWAIDRLAESLPGPVPVLMITKGLATDGHAIEPLPFKVAREIERRRGFAAPVMAVGGPCIAGELAALRDTGVVITGGDPALIDRAIGALGGGFYHARPSADVVGVEVCAAFKNFFALGVGSAAGRFEREGKAANGALMHNLAANLFAQSVREMAVLTEALGGDRATASGMAGVGDLYVTCQAGRNSRMGRLLGLGMAYAEAKAQQMAADTVEGAELGLAVGPTLETMMADGRLDRRLLPMTCALLDTLLRGQPFTADYAAFHR
jgi:glycerol-3-phosphate dehydrogenase (NAD(P)+)